MDKKQRTHHSRESTQEIREQERTLKKRNLKILLNVNLLSKTTLRMVYIGPILSKSNKATPTLTWKTRLSNLNKATPKNKSF